MDHHGTLKTATFSPLFPSNVPRAHWNGHDFASLLGFHLSLCCMTLWQQLNINEAYPAWVKFLWKQKRKEYYTHKSSLLCVFFVIMSLKVKQVVPNLWPINGFDSPQLKCSVPSFVISVQTSTYWMEWSNKGLDLKASSQSPNRYSSRARSRSTVR